VGIVDLGGEGMSYEEWQAKRVKDEVKSFMKQLITEVRPQCHPLPVFLSSPY
jgi:hypothetical protein